MAASFCNLILVLCSCLTTEISGSIIKLCFLLQATYQYISSGLSVVNFPWKPLIFQDQYWRSNWRVPTCLLAQDRWSFTIFSTRAWVSGITGLPCTQEFGLKKCSEAKKYQGYLVKKGMQPLTHIKEKKKIQLLLYIKDLLNILSRISMMDF